MTDEQLALFGAEAMAPQPMPEGFRYAPDAINAAEEARLAACFADLPFKRNRSAKGP